ncbi:hypothetical protein K7X08_017450 [Anisodus acutangulus]|uniref:Uncharacterized protein n=1 Tax=Anisodus acutangulus TaxID=402998 RepID=A0A9Q1LXD9_9SOLA|nr:hypothetical protein K7X08_017450 [Anisodus acutangulus]
MVGSEGMLGSGLACNGGRVIFGTTEANVGKDGNGGNVAAAGNKFGILGNCGIGGKLGSCNRLRAAWLVVMLDKDNAMTNKRIEQLLGAAIVNLLYIALFLQGKPSDVGLNKGNSSGYTLRASTEEIQEGGDLSEELIELEDVGGHQHGHVPTKESILATEQVDVNQQDHNFGSQIQFETFQNSSLDSDIPSHEETYMPVDEKSVSTPFNVGLSFVVVDDVMVSDEVEQFDDLQTSQELVPYSQFELLDKFLCSKVPPIIIVMTLRKNCGMYVAAFVEYLSLGEGISDVEFNDELLRIRYGALLWDYAKQKIESEVVSDDEAPLKPPTVPQLPTIPNFPAAATLPPLPSAASLPTLPSVPKMSLPPLPANILPNMPSLPNIPTIPSIPTLSPPPSN